MADRRLRRAEASLRWRRRRDLVAERDRPAGDDVGAKPAAVHQRSQQSRPGERLQVTARFGQASTDALDATDGEALADEAVQGDAARDDIAPRLLPGKL